MISILLISCEEKSSNNVSQDVFPTPTVQESEEPQSSIEEVADSVLEDFDLKPKVSLVEGVEYTAVDYPIVLPKDLEVGQYGKDFTGNCLVYRTKKGSYIECDKHPCSELERKYLISRYTAYEVAIRKNKRVNYFRSMATARRLKKYNKCEHVHLTSKINKWEAP